MSEQLSLVFEVLAGLFLLLVLVAFLLELVMLALRPVIRRFIVWNGMSELIIGLVLGVLVAFWLELDAYSIIFRIPPSILGIILTGLIIGRGGHWMMSVVPGISPGSVSPGPPPSGS